MMLSTARPPREPLPPGWSWGRRGGLDRADPGSLSAGSRIGAGASGTVFAATDPDQDGPVVVKFFDGEEDAYAAWAGELRLVLRFRHPHIVPCLDIGFDTVFACRFGVRAGTMGSSLRRRLVEGRRLTPEIAGCFVRRLGPAYAHAQG